jgi:hypothetical protein
MEEKHLRRIKVRRGSNLQRKQVLFEEGEFVYVNDIKKLYIGDIKTYGGIKVSNNNRVILKKSKPIEADIGDILYNKLDKSTYIVNKSEELELISYSVDDLYKHLKQIKELEDLLDKLEKFCCNNEFALDTDDGVNIFTDYGDWIKVKDPDPIITTICNSPIIASKYLKLKSKKTYTLDITNSKSDLDILFFNNLIDRDTSDPIQPIKIVENSISSSSNIKIIDVTDTTIKFIVDELPPNVSVGMGVYIDYDIENDCGSIQNQKGSMGGLVYNSNVTIKTAPLGSYGIYSSNSSYTMYQVLDKQTNEYPFDQEGWFLFYYDAFGAPDTFYLTMFDKTPSLKDGNTNINSYIYGPFIGSNPLEGCYIFYHPKDTDINVWNQGGGSSGWFVLRLGDITKNRNSPDFYFTDINKKPTKIQAIGYKNMYSEENSFISLDKVKDYTDIVKKSVTVPPFIKIY